MKDAFNNSPLPRYAQLADLLRQRIARGVWKEGDLLPSLDALAAEFGVARVTVRQAIERLTPHRCCVVYGQLPPETRSKQARLFNEEGSG